MLRYIALLSVFCVLAVSSAAQGVEFNYNGRVNVLGTPFEGQGQFKFTLTNRDGTITHWANDGQTLDGTEPTTAVTVTVHDGFFSIDIGDTDIPGMAPLIASIFNSMEDVYLRVWFNDGASGFERLLPDRKIVNPALLGLQSSEEINIYVDALSGNDLNSGLTTDTAKQTLQAAWNAVPVVSNQNVTIQLLPGVYREQVTLKGKFLGDGKHIVIRGNTEDPSSVRLTGADEGSETTPRRDFGIIVELQSDLELEGIAFDTFSKFGLYVSRFSEVVVRHCTARDAVVANFHAIHSSILEINHTDFSTTTNRAYSYVSAYTSSIVILRHCKLTGPYARAVDSHYNGRITFESCTLKNFTVGVAVNRGGSIGFAALIPKNVIENCSIGVDARTQAMIENANTEVVYINTPTKVRAQDATVALWN